MAESESLYGIKIPRLGREHEDEGLVRRDSATGDGAVSTSGDTAVKPLVDNVVPRACGTAQQHVEGDETGRQPHRHRHFRWHHCDTSCVGDADETRYVECVEASRSIETHDLGVGDPGARDHREESGSGIRILGR